ncbi:fanconi-associated nuclease 1-like [Rhynchophorus ferrugineus]|uniref:fanconi-associated nuclease 1-like n=1 Tax=Rhynchophorus ferrugineus TaxID=354439 RepID=UPI003FCCF14F
MPKKKGLKSKLNLSQSEKNFRQLSIMECFNKKCKSKQAFKFKSPTLVSNVSYEINTETEESLNDLDNTISYDCNLSNYESKIKIISVLKINNNDSRYDKTVEECTIQTSKELQSSISDIEQIKNNCNNTQNKMQGNPLKVLPKCQDNKRQYQKENVTLSPKKLKAVPKDNATLGDDISYANSLKPKEHQDVQQLKVVCKTNASPVSSRDIKTRSVSNIKPFKAKEGKQLQDKQLKTFVELINSIYKSVDLRNLLSIDECKVLRIFLRLDEKCQYSILKLYTWKKKWYNIFTFCKKANIEIEDDKDVTDIFQSLACDGFVDTDYYTNYNNIPSLLETLNKNDIEDIMTNLKIKRCKSKNENIDKLIARMETQQTLYGTFKEVVMSEIKKHIGFSFKLSNEKITAFNNIYTLATFTNPVFRNIQDYFNHVIYKGMVYPYTSIENVQIFSRRAQFENYAEALRIYNRLDEIKSVRGDKIEIWDIGRNIYDKLNNLEREEPEKTTPHLYKYRAEYVYVKILTECSESIFTKTNGFPEYVATWLDFLIKTFPNYKIVGKWYSRLIWLYMSHLEPIDYEKASQLMIEALTKCKDDEISLHDLANLAKKMKDSKKYKIKQIYHDQVAFMMPRLIKESDIPTEHINALTLPNINKAKRKMFVVKDLSNDDITIKNVEDVALSYYEQNGYQGFHCENSLIHALFMLFFWDIIYSPPRNIPAIFVSSIQTGPLDIFTEYFYDNRKRSFEERLLQIESKWTLKETVEFARNNYQEHSHEWSVFGPVINIVPEKKIVDDVVTVIGQTLLSKILERLVKNLKQFRSGMPDLFLYNVEEQKCKFVEVKSSTDRLATNQLLWLKYLQSNGADVAVCWVNNSNKAKKSQENPAKD